VIENGRAIDLLLQGTALHITIFSMALLAGGVQLFYSSFPGLSTVFSQLQLFCPAG
jgi:hypothetical protein